MGALYEGVGKRLPCLMVLAVVGLGSGAYDTCPHARHPQPGPFPQNAAVRLGCEVLRGGSGPLRDDYIKKDEAGAKVRLSVMARPFSLE
jgi:hypothetical protein